MKTIRAVAAVSLFVASLGVAVVPAVAAPPANDTYSGREVLTDPLPITVMADTTEATTDADDTEMNMLCGAPATDASVWYEYAPSAEVYVEIDTLASDFSVGAIVATGGPGSFAFESCGPEVVGFMAMPGTTYTILVFDDQVDGGGNGGQLQFTLDQATPPPPPPSIEVSVDPRGSFDARTGAATVSGTYTCAPSNGGAVEFAAVNVQLSQRAGRVYIQGSGFVDVDPATCDGTEQPWTITTEWASGLFKGGKAEAQVFADVCGAQSCGFFETLESVKLSGAKK